MAFANEHVYLVLQLNGCLEESLVSARVASDLNMPVSLTLYISVVYLAEYMVYLVLTGQPRKLASSWDRVIVRGSWVNTAASARTRNALRSMYYHSVTFLSTLHFSCCHMIMFGPTPWLHAAWMAQVDSDVSKKSKKYKSQSQKSHIVLAASI